MKRDRVWHLTFW